MRQKLYNCVLDLTSKMLNYCVKHKYWKWCYKLIEFRKKYIASNLRIIIKNDED